MSPTRSPRGKKATTKSVTIEFSGIATLVWDSKAGRAEVRLVDLGSAGFQRHYAALGYEVSQSSPRGIRGPDADAAVSVLGEDRDIGVWNLLGTEVEIVGATGKLTVDDTKVDVTKRPAKNATSVRWLADIGFLTESTAPDPVCPLAAVIHLPAGHITASRAVDARKIEFVDDGQPVGPVRYCVSRFKVEIPFEQELAIRLSRARVIRVTDSLTLMISNTCVCGLGSDRAPDHFYGHYEVVRAKRRPRIEPAPGKGVRFPEFPEWCYVAMVRM